MEEHNKYSLNFRERKDFDFKKVYGDHAIIMVDSALKLGLKVDLLFDRYLEISNGRKRHLFQSVDSTAVSRLGTLMSEDKEKTKYFLKREGISTPEGKLFWAGNEKEIIKYAERFENFVLKPKEGDCGDRVYIGLPHSAIKKILASNFSKNEEIILEEKVEGKEYRIFAIENGYIAGVFRRPASVVGDGKRNLEELIWEKNLDRKKGFLEKGGSPFREIKINHPLVEYLKAKKIELKNIPSKDQRVYLRENSNLSTGGDSISIDTEKISSGIKEAAIKSIKAIPGFPYGGVDIITKDITNPDEKHFILEINHLPGIKGLHYPYIGSPQNPGGEVLKYLFF